MTIRGLAYGLLGLWTLFAALSYLYPTDVVFTHLNAMAVAAGLMTIIAYSPVFHDAWHQRRGGVSPAHVLALGIITNWIGFTVRLGRWFVTDAIPVAGGVAAWAYNVGLWISITGAVLLVGALALSEPKWSNLKTWLHLIAFIALTGALWYFERLT